MDYFVDLACIAVDAAVFGILCYACKSQGEILQALEKAEHLSINKNLSEKILSSKDQVIPYAVIQGNVKALQKPLLEKYLEDTQAGSGVIQTITVNKHYLQWSFLSRFWINTTEEVDNITNVIPFGLCNTSSKSPIIEIANVMDCADLPSNIKTKSFFPNTEPWELLSSLTSWLSGKKFEGTEVIETMLSEGTSLTAIGELHVESGASNNIKLRAPTSGLPIFLSTASLTALIRDVRTQLTTNKVLANIAGLVGIVLIVQTGIKYYNLLQKKLAGIRNQKKVKKILEARADSDDGLNRQCVVCLTNPLEVVILNCGHLCLCLDCEQVMSNMSSDRWMCPICRSPVNSTTPVFIP